MKFYLFLFALLGLVLWEKNLETPPAKKPIAMCGMAQFVDDPAFQQLHPYPRPVTPEFQEQGEMISFPVEGGENANAYMVKAKEESKLFLFVIHEWWGLNDNIKEQTDRLAGDLTNVNMLALDLYDGKVASNREDARKYMSSASPERIEAIIKAAREYAGEDVKIASIGWCFGGGQSLRTALILGDAMRACVIYYGMPTRDVEVLKTLETDVLGIFANEDRYITPEVVAEFKASMEEAEKGIQVYQFDADHAFANPSGARYNEDAAEEAYEITLRYLRDRLDY